LISPIIASFERVEIERIEGIFDQISVSYHFGGMEKSCAINLLRTVADDFTYNGYLSRNVNFRWSDHSSVFKSPNKGRYLKRLFDKEGAETVERIIRERPIFQSQGHDQMQFVKLLLEAWPETFRMIEIVRDPIDQIDAWIRRDWGTRYCTDPMALTPCFKCKDQAVPFYAYGWGEEYLEMPPIDRIIKMLYKLQFENRNAYESLSKAEKQQIMIIRFEDFVANTFEYVNNIAMFLDTSTTKNTKPAINAQGCPRYQDPTKKLRRFELIKKDASKQSLALVDEMIADYKNDWV
jgi:hypothetical protein